MIHPSIYTESEVRYMIPRIDYDMMFRESQERLDLITRTDRQMDPVESQEKLKWFLSKHFIRATAKS